MCFDWYVYFYRSIYVILKVFPVSMSCLLPTDCAGAADDQPQVYFCTQAVYPALATVCSKLAFCDILGFIVSGSYTCVVLPASS